MLARSPSSNSVNIMHVHEMFGPSLIWCLHEKLCLELYLILRSIYHATSDLQLLPWWSSLSSPGRGGYPKAASVISRPPSRFDAVNDHGQDGIEWYVLGFCFTIVSRLRWCSPQSGEDCLLVNRISITVFTRPFPLGPVPIVHDDFGLCFAELFHFAVCFWKSISLFIPCDPTLRWNLLNCDNSPCWVIIEGFLDVLQMIFTSAEGPAAKICCLWRSQSLVVGCLVLR